VISLASSILHGKLQFVKHLHPNKIFNCNLRILSITRAEIYRIRSMAYLFLNQYQFRLDDATVGFKLLSDFIQQIQTNCL
jgi:hypothetical protein